MTGPVNRNVLAIKWGSLYDANYVNRLYAMVRRHLSGPFRFVCLTDHAEGLLPEIESRPIPDLGLPESAGRMAWPKVSVFHPSLGDLQGTCLFLDLDVVLVDRIDELFEFQPGRFCLIHDWVQPHRRWIAARPNVGNSSVFRFDAGTMNYIVDHFVPNQEAIMQDFRNEQRFLTHMVEDKLAWWPTPWVVSFKRHCIPTFPLNWVRAPTVPEGAKVVAFHGTPKPDQVEHGYRHGWRRRTRPAAWIAENWAID